MKCRLLSASLLVSAAAVLLAGAPAQAASVVLWPIDPVIANGERATALWIENRGQDAVTLQVRSFAWSQSGGDDRYDRQDAVIASPPIAHVAPGQRQLVRIIRRDAAAGPSEHSYRLLIDELPPPIDAGKPDAVSAHLAVQMRYSIPLFAYDGTGAAARPALSARTVLVDGQPFAEIHNTGGLHARLVNLRLVRGGHVVTATAGLVGYVLGGATMRWPLPKEAPIDSAILVNVNGTDTSLAPTA